MAPGNNTAGRPHLWMGVFVLLASFALLLPMFLPGRSLPLLLAALAGVLIVVYPLQRALRHGEPDFFEPILFTTLVCFPILLRPLYWLLVGEVELAGYPLDRDQALRAALWAATWLYLGQIVYYASYYGSRKLAAPPSLLPRFSPRWSAGRLRVAIIVSTLIGGFCYWLLLDQVGGLSYFLTQLYQRRKLTAELGPLYVGALLLSNAMLIWFFWGVRERLRLLIWLPFAALMLVALGTLGGRGAVLVPILLVVIGWHYLVKRLGFLKLALRAALMILFAVAYVQVRTATLTERGFRPAILAERRWSAPSVLEKYFVDQNYLDTFAVLIDDMPRTLPFQYGKTWLHLLVWPIPRKLWPDKPPAFEGSIIGQTYFGGWGRPAGFAGALYMNFHVPGILIGYFLLGRFHRALYAYLRSQPKNPGAVAFYAVSVVFLTGFTNLSISQWLVYGLPLFLTAKFVALPVAEASVRLAESQRQRVLSGENYA